MAWLSLIFLKWKKVNRVINRLLNINELTATLWVDYQGRDKLRQRVSYRVSSISKFDAYKRALDMEVEMDALKAILVFDLLWVWSQSRSVDERTAEVQIEAQITDYELMNINQLYLLWTHTECHNFDVFNSRR